MKYRREIDGLRALAVVPVILFHAGFEAFSGGFVGVDVFFVISGYLITSIILAEQAAGSFTLAGFYERRARRILPALFVVLAACIPFAWAWMFPADLEGFANSLVAVCVFASNIVFSREAGYFDTAAELKPLLHTWSLAVEEQYYIFFPLIVALVWRFARRWMWAVFIAMALISLLAAELRVASRPAPTFYLLPTRGWELLIGGMLALYAFQRPAVADVPPRWGLRAWAPVLGVVLIGVAVFAFDKTTPFPGLTALLPTLGAALLIQFADARVGVGRLLGARAVVGLGLISYSLYLWHQPLFAFARIRSADEPGLVLIWGLIAAAFVLAYLSWRFVERPFRERKRFSRRRIFGLSFAATGAFFTVGAFGVVQHGFPQRFSPELVQVFAPETSRLESGVCTPRTLKDQPRIRLCEFGRLDAPRTVALYGDSHAEALIATLDESLRRQNIRGVKVSVENCEPLPTVVSINAQRGDDREQKLARCRPQYQALLEHLRTNVDAVIVHMRWTMRVYPIEGEVDRFGYDNGEGGVELFDEKRYSTLDGPGAAAKAAAIDHLMSSMRSLDKPLVLVYPVPEVGWDVPRVNYKTYLTTGEIPQRISTSHKRFEVRNAFVHRALDAVGDDPRLRRIRPEHLLCSTREAGRCLAQLDGVPLYGDDDHLSNAGARLVSDAIAKAIGR